MISIGRFANDITIDFDGRIGSKYHAVFVNSGKLGKGHASLGLRHATYVLVGRLRIQPALVYITGMDLVFDPDLAQ